MLRINAWPTNFVCMTAEKTPPSLNYSIDGCVHDFTQICPFLYLAPTCKQ